MFRNWSWHVLARRTRREPSVAVRSFVLRRSRGRLVCRWPDVETGRLQFDVPLIIRLDDRPYQINSAALLYFNNCDVAGAAPTQSFDESVEDG